MEIAIEQLITLYEKALVTKPDNSLVYSKLVELYFNQGNLEAAVDTYQKALQINPNFAFTCKTFDKIVPLVQETAKGDSFNWLEMEAELTINHPNGVEKIWQGEIDGMLIKKVFSKSEILKFKEEVEARRDLLIPQKFGGFIGPTMRDATASGISRSDMKEYFREASIFRKQLKNIFCTNFEARIESILGNMSGSRTVELLRASMDDICVPANLRIFHTHKGGIKPHNDKKIFIRLKVEKFLHEIADTRELISFFIIINNSDKGGELVLYNLPRKQAKQKELQYFLSTAPDKYFEKLPQKHLQPEPGDMVLFNSGRIWHKIAEIEGQNNRITIGGWVIKSKDDKKLLYFG